MSLRHRGYLGEAKGIVDYHSLTLKDFNYQPIVRIVKKKKQWTEHELKQLIDKEVDKQFRKKYRPRLTGHWSPVDLDSWIRHMGRQFIFKLQRDGKMSHVGFMDRSGKVEKYGYGDWVYSVK